MSDWLPIQDLLPVASNTFSLICLEWTLRPSNWWIQLEKLLPAIFKFNRWFTIFEPLKFCRSCWIPQAELHPSTLDRFGRWPWTSGVAYNTPGWTVLYNRWYTVHLVLLLCGTSHIQHSYRAFITQTNSKLAPTPTSVLVPIFHPQTSEMSLHGPGKWPGGFTMHD